MNSSAVPILLARSLVASGALLWGVILGYFTVDAPIIPVATNNVVEWFVPFVKDIDTWLYARDARYLLVAGLVFVATLPNVVLLSFLVALSMKVFRRPRLVFYATLVWPVFHYLLDLDRILRVKAGLSRLGLNPDVRVLINAENLPTKAVGMLLVYSIFAVLVFLIYRQLARIRHSPPLNSVVPPDGGGPAS